MKSRIITVSAIAAGLTAICLTVGVYVGFADIFALIISSVFVILPLYVKSYKGCIMSYLAGGVLGLLFGRFDFITTFVFPAYFAFFGIYPIVSCFFREKKLKRSVANIVGAIWCIAVFYGLYFYYTGIMGLDFSDLPEYFLWIKDYILYAVGVLGLCFYFVYDRFIYVIRALIDRYLGKIIK